MSSVERLLCRLRLELRSRLELAGQGHSFSWLCRRVKATVEMQK